MWLKQWFSPDSNVINLYTHKYYVLNSLAKKNKFGCVRFNFEQKMEDVIQIIQGFIIKSSDRKN